MDFNTSSNYSLQRIYLVFWGNLSLGLIGFTLNIGVCLIISTHSILRQPFNYLILNLSFSDIFVSCAVILNGVLDYFNARHQLSYTASSIICYINVAFLVIPLPAACLTLLIMSIERYQAIAVVHLRHLQLSTVRKVITIIWLIVIMTAFIPIAHAKLNLYYPYECAIGRIDNFQILILLLVSFTLTSILPVGITLIIYVIILYKLIRELTVVQPTLLLVQRRREKQLKHSILPVLLISIFSAASSTPYILLTYYTTVNQYYNPLFRAPFVQKYYGLWLMTAILFNLTPIINPLLYNLASSKFREALNALICGHFCSAVKKTTVPIRPLQLENCNSSISGSRIQLSANKSIVR